MTCSRTAAHQVPGRISDFSEKGSAENGSVDTAADDRTRPHPNLADDRPAVNAPTNHHAPTSPAPHHTAPRSCAAVSGENGSASGCKSDAYHRK